MIDRSLLTPIAVVIGGGLIGLGLYFGLQRRESVPVPTSATAGASLDAPSASSPPALGVASSAAETATAAPSSAASASRTSSEQQVRETSAALEKHRKLIDDECVKPALAKQPQPATVKLTFQYVFDASGKQIARGVGEDRATSRPDVTQCVLAKLPQISITAPGEQARVELVWTLP